MSDALLVQLTRQPTPPLAQPRVKLADE
uniref:Uncharacterized protein n=1 Tax=Arundo donax TaxID=35708 RepID=A0A0A8XXW8_ARUDO